MNIYFDKTIYEKNRKFYDDSLKFLNKDKNIESEMVADVNAVVEKGIKKFFDNRLEELHDRLSYINQINGRDREWLESSLRDFEIKLNYIEIETNKISEQLKSVDYSIEKQINQQNRISERIDRFEKDINNIKNLFKICSNLILFYIVIHTIIEYSEKFFGFNLIKFFRGFVN